MTEPEGVLTPLERAAARLRWARLGLLLLAALGMGAAYTFGLLDLFAHPAALRHTLLELGPWGYAWFLVAYAVLQPFGVPGTVFVFAAPLIWPWPVAFALSMSGTMAASVVGFSFARFVARDWVSRRIPARFLAYQEAITRRAFLTVVTLRFIFWMPPLLHAFFGVSKVRFGTHFWGSLVGYAVPLLLVSYFGEAVFDAARELPAGAWVGIGAALLGVGTLTWALRRRRLARREPPII